MIGRVWRGWASAEDARAYEALFRERILPALREIGGFVDAYVLRKDLEDEMQITTITCDGMSPSVLSARLAELRGAGVVGKDAEGNYYLTEEGRSLLEALDPLRGWPRRRAGRVAAEVEYAERGSQR